MGWALPGLTLMTASCRCDSPGCPVTGSHSESESKMVPGSLDEVEGRCGVVVVMAVVKGSCGVVVVMVVAEVVEAAAGFFDWTPSSGPLPLSTASNHEWSASLVPVVRGGVGVLNSSPAPWSELNRERTSAEVKVLPCVVVTTGVVADALWTCVLGGVTAGE